MELVNEMPPATILCTEKLRWTHLSRQFFRKVKLHFGAVICFYLCAHALNGGLSIAKFCPPADLSRSMAGEGDLAVGNPVESHGVHQIAL